MSFNREEITKHIMLSAEGGADYWAEVTFPDGVDEEFLPVATIRIKDMDPDGVGQGKEATFTVEELEKVIDDYAENAPYQLKSLSNFQNRFRKDWASGRFDVIDYDHETADLIAQWALFDGHVIYG